MHTAGQWCIMCSGYAHVLSHTQSHRETRYTKYLTVTDVLSALSDNSFHYRQQLTVFNLNRYTLIFIPHLIFHYDLQLIPATYIYRGWAKKTGLFSDLITLWRLVLERRAVCQNFRNFIEKRYKTRILVSLNILCQICSNRHNSSNYGIYDQNTWILLSLH